MTPGLCRYRNEGLTVEVAGNTENADESTFEDLSQGIGVTKPASSNSKSSMGEVVRKVTPADPGVLNENKDKCLLEENSSPASPSISISPSSRTRFLTFSCVHLGFMPSRALLPGTACLSLCLCLAYSPPQSRASIMPFAQDNIAVCARPLILPLELRTRPSINTQA